MALSFREIARNDEDLLKLLEISDHHSLLESVDINISDINGICAKITKINTMNPKWHSSRVAWTVTGRLLIGLTMYFDFQVQICLEESQRLKESCIRHSFVVERTKTTKRKIKQVTTTNNKRKRTVEIEIEEETIEQQRFWEEPLELDRNFKFPRDSCLVPADQITIRELNEPSIGDTIGDAFEELDDTFGDEGHDFQFDDYDQMEMLSIVHGQPPQQIYDENMNDIVASNIDQEDIEGDALQPPQVTSQHTVQNATVAEEQQESSSNLLNQLAPLSLSAVAVKQSKKKRRTTIFMDTEKLVPGEVMKRRISNAFVSCKKRISVSIQEKNPLQTLKKKPIDLFSVPAINGIYNRKVFEEHAIIKPVETDWTIIQDAFEPANHETSNVNDENNEQNSHVSIEVDILRNESESQRQLRQSLNVDEPPSTKRLRSSTPRRPFSRQSIRCSTPVTLDSNVHTPNLIISPPLHLQQWHSGSEINPSQPLAPPVDFGDDCQSNFELQAPPRRQLFQQPSEHDATAQFDERPELIAILGENSLEYIIISKLMVLWRKLMHPIKVEHLLSPRSNRIQAAKTFASLLILKKKKLVQLENSDDGKITHISKGEELKLDETE